MNRLVAEVDANYARFYTRWTEERALVEASLGALTDRYRLSYRRLVTLSAWYSGIVEDRIGPGAAQFFSEARNDAISSHVFARLGSWRASLKFLRSCVENILSCHYYADHQVELELWRRGKHRMGFSELIAYFRSHPQFDLLSDQQSGVARLVAEYGTLSKAVHGSASAFRMTDEEGLTNLWTDDRVRFGAWSTRERHVLGAANLFLVAVYRDDLQGAAHPGLRQSLGFVFSSPHARQQIADWFNVVIPEFT